MNAFLLAAAVVVSLSSLGCATATALPLVAKPVAIDGDRPLAVRTDAGSLWVGSHVWSETRLTWKKPAQGQIEELSIRPIDGGHEITFVQGGLTWRGTVDGDHHALGPLQAMPALDARSGWNTDAPSTTRAADAGFAILP